MSQANQTLKEAQKKARRTIRRGVTGFVLLLVMSAGVVAWTEVERQRRTGKLLKELEDLGQSLQQQIEAKKTVSKQLAEIRGKIVYAQTELEKERLNVLLKQSGSASTQLESGLKTLREASASLRLPLQLNDSGPEVTELQRKLADAGFYTGAVDGVFGLRTQSVLRNFQCAKGLVADGIAGPQPRNSCSSIAATWWLFPSKNQILWRKYASILTLLTWLTLSQELISMLEPFLTNLALRSRLRRCAHEA